MIFGIASFTEKTSGASLNKSEPDERREQKNGEKDEEAMAISGFALIIVVAGCDDGTTNQTTTNISVPEGNYQQLAPKDM